MAQNLIRPLNKCAAFAPSGNSSFVAYKRTSEQTSDIESNEDTTPSTSSPAEIATTTTVTTTSLYVPETDK